MATSDGEKWDERYRNATPPHGVAAPEIVSAHLGDLGTGNRVLDVACGFGDAGLWLAGRGADVTFADVSAVALAAVRERADQLAASITTTVVDLETEPVPAGPWDAITNIHYLDRDLLARLTAELSSTGRLVVAIATTTNLERHERPSARFLLDPDELPTLLPEAHVLHFSEAWRANDVHEAWGVFTTTRQASL